MRSEIFSVDARGQKWSGTWYVDGKDLHVSSAYGSTKESLGRRKPIAVATKLLVNQVSAWTRARA